MHQRADQFRVLQVLLAAAERSCHVAINEYVLLMSHIVDVDRARNYIEDLLHEPLTLQMVFHRSSHLVKKNAEGGSDECQEEHAHEIQIGFVAKERTPRRHEQIVAQQ